MNRNINRIIAYGDSYTAGDELMDHVHMNMSFEECNRIKKQYIADGMTLDAKSKFKDKYDIWTADKELNCKHSWAAYLARHLDLDFLNKGLNGSSIDYVYFTIYQDMLKGNIRETDLVLVGLSTPFRIIDFRDKHQVKTLMVNHVDGNNLENKLLIELFTDDFALFQYFKAVGLLANLNSKINIRLQPMIPEIDSAGWYNTIHTNDYVKSVWNDSLKSMLLPNEFLRPPLVDGEPNMCGFSHPPVESHIELADKIYKQIKF